MSERTPYDGGAGTGAGGPGEGSELSELIDLAAVARDDALVEALRRRSPRQELDRLDGFDADPVAGLLAALAADVDLLAGVDPAAGPLSGVLLSGASQPVVTRPMLTQRSATPSEAAPTRELPGRAPSEAPRRGAGAGAGATPAAASAAEVLPLLPAGAGRVARGSRRAGAAAVVVAGLVSVSGVAAALTGDPLAPYVGIAHGITHGIAAVASGGSPTADGRHGRPVPSGVPSGRPDGPPSALASGAPVGSPAATAAQLDAGLSEVDQLVAQGRDAEAAARLQQLEQLLGRNDAVLPPDQVRTWQDRIDTLQQELPGGGGKSEGGQPSDRPEHPTQAAQPTHPAHPAHPTQAAGTTRPAHPTQAATPAPGGHGQHASPTPSASDTAPAPESTTVSPAPEGTGTATATAPAPGNGKGNGKGNGTGNGNGKGTGKGTGSAHGNSSVAGAGHGAAGNGR